MTQVALHDPTSLGTRAASTWKTRLGWAATDDVAVTGYEVQVRRGSGTWTGAYLGAATARTLSLPLGRVSVRVRATDAAGNWSKWRSITRTTIVTDLTAVATRSHTSSWASSTARAAAWSGTRYVTTAIGQRLSVKVDGQGLALVAQQGTSGGRIAIVLDGAQVAVVDLASSSTRDRRVVWSTTWPTRGLHTVEVRTLDSPGADTVWLDALLTER